MAGTAVSPQVRPLRRKVLRLALIAAVLLLTAIVCIGAWFGVAAYRALPQVDGSISVAQLAAPAKVVRDAQGVPHITAASLDDLMFAQGYVTAQDRFWQMDLTRRYASGELAEVLGKDFLQSDIEQRTLMLRVAAERAAAALPERERVLFEAYARGVNAYIDSHRDRLPLEFRVLGYDPKPWTVVDSFLVGASLAKMLTFDSIEHLLSRERVTSRIGPELAADLFPNFSWRDHPPGADMTETGFAEPDAEQLKAEEEQQRRGPRRRSRRTRSSSRAALSSPVSDLAEDSSLVPGSNNWVVSGARTASGKPLLSNDMHLPHQIPNIWYEAHLTSGSFDVAGVSVPGLPAVISGHNQRIAWGFTNIAPAVYDVYVERFNERGEYETPQGWQAPERREEVIRVKRSIPFTGHREEKMEVLVTRHGPIISRLSPGETRQLALKWTIYSSEGFTFPFFDLNAAQNWEEFRRACSRFANPGQNVVYADIDGNIGYQATGRVPTRAAGDASAPVPGHDDSHEWTGFVPFEQMPSIYNPPSGLLATANSRITPDTFPYLISAEWASPYRTERIYRVLTTTQKLTPADMLALQTDIHSTFDRFLAQRFAYAIDRTAASSQRARQAAEILRKWDGRLTEDSAAASLVASSRRELIRLLLEPKLGDSYKDYDWFMASVWLENVLLKQPARWLPRKYASFDALLADSVEQALTRDGVPRDLNKWRWGKVLSVELRHPIFGGIPILRRWASTGVYEQSGNGYTVKQVGRRFGPSERLTVDFADLDNSTLNIVNGQSGHLFSRHFMDQWTTWHGGQTYVLPYSSSAVDKAKVNELILEPAR